VAFLVGLSAAAALLCANRATTDEGREDEALAAFDRGQAERRQALKLLNEPEEKRHGARKHFEEAAQSYRTAQRAFAARAPQIDPPVKTLSRDFECAACCRCSVAEMHLRLGRFKDAVDTLLPFVDESLYRQSRFRDLALYYHGLACYRLGDLDGAGRSLDQLAPFTNARHGLHARYLLARALHQLGELPEAALHYEGVIHGYQAQRKYAEEALHHPGRFGADPDEKARLQAVLDQPAPDLVVRSIFCLGVLQYEQGRFEESQKAFVDFLAGEAPSSLKKDAQLCLGMTLVQLGKNTEAIEALKTIADKDPARAAQSSFWLGKAYASSANHDDAEGFQETLDLARKSLRRSADLVKTEASKDAARRGQQGEILLELAAVQHAGGQHQDAANTLRSIADGGLLPARAEEVLQRQATAAHLAGHYQESEELCARFVERYPSSPLRAEVDFRHAENAHFLALERSGADRENMLAESAKRYRRVVDAYPEFELLPWAQHELAMAHYRRGEFDLCREILERIPFTERRGPLSSVSYLLADCLIRTAPAQADDALAAGQLQENLQAAVEMLGGYVEDRPEPPLAPEALLRLGCCRLRLSALQAKPEEHDRLRDLARADFERLLIDYPLHDLQPHASLERSRCLASDDVKPLIARLRRFTQDPLRKSPVAPLALLRLACLLRSQDGGAREAATILARCRKDQEKTLLADVRRTKWAPLLLFHHALALSDSGKPHEAGVLLEQLLSQFPNDPSNAESMLRREQCHLADGWQIIEQANRRMEAIDATEEDKSAAKKQREDGWQMVRDAAARCEKMSDELASKKASPEVRATLLYQAAWIHRSLAEPEVNAVREKLQQDLQKRLQEEAARNVPPGQAVPGVAAVEVPISQVPVQPQEKKARAVYARLIREQPELALAVEAALELAEMHAEREDHATAIKLLKSALDREPSAELADKLRLRLAMCSLAMKDEKTALGQFEIVAGRPDSQFAAQAHLRAAECLLAQGKRQESLKMLLPFRDKEDFRNLSGLSDRALVLLGHTLSQLEKWDDSRTAFALVISNFGQGPLAEQARYRLAWTHFKQNKHQAALQVLEQFDTANSTEVGRRARLLQGICHLERKHYQQAIEILSDLATDAISDVAALALLEYSHAQSLRNKPAEAKKLLLQLIEKYPDTDWARIARDRSKPGADDKAPPYQHELGQRVLTPRLLPPIPLEPLGQMQAIDPSTDDPTAAFSLDYALSTPPPERSVPAPTLRLVVSDPFENREAMKGMLPLEEPLPVNEEISLPTKP
jgi:TolA-binding protein